MTRPATVFPAVVVPFPVEPEYHVRADMRRLTAGVPEAIDPGERTLTRVDREWHEYLTARLARVRAAPHEVRALDPEADVGRLAAAGRRLAAALAAERPSLLAVGEDRLRLRGVGLEVGSDGTVVEVPGRSGEADLGGDGAGLRALAAAAAEQIASRPPPLRWMEALSWTLQEDLVLITAGGRAAYLHVAFPSGWDPGGMGGASFERLHAPVPRSEGLRRAAPAVVRAMVAKGPFLRYVWSVQPGMALDRHPSRLALAAGAPPEPPLLDALSLRVERQTTLPMADLGCAAFLIRVVRAPLRTVLTSAERRLRLAAALSTMDPEVARYKGLAGLAEALVGESS
jgi:hypothetical protein